MPDATFRKRLRAWIVLAIPPLLFAGVMVSNYGDRQRGLFYTGYFDTMSTKEWIEQRFARVRGLPRLAAVVDHFGMSATNDFFLRELYRDGINSGDYADWEVFHVSRYAIHSVGASGPGGPFIACGVIGVVAAYIFWGGFWMCLYEHVSISNTATGSALYMVLIIFLLNVTISENFTVSMWKPLFACTMLAGVISRFKK